MGICFAIIPFDSGGPFDKRFDDSIAPAITAAGLEPYRIDRDANAVILIDDIETGIRGADICFADITTDNANVWYELGFALASGKEVVLICEEGKREFPFDIRHRRIIKYKTEAPRDFVKLTEELSAALTAALNRRQTMEAAASPSVVAPVAGLSPQELSALVSIAESDEPIASWTLRHQMSNVGFTDIATKLATRRIQALGLVDSTWTEDRDGNSFTAYVATDQGMDWLERNQSKLVLRYERAKEPSKVVEPDIDDLPF